MKNTKLAGFYTPSQIKTATAAMTAGILCLMHLAVQNNGIDHLHDCLGNILPCTAGLGKRTVIRRIRRALKDADITLAAVHDHLFLLDRNALKFLASTAAQAGLEGDLDIKLNGHGIKAAVKANRIDADIRPGNARVFRAYVGGVLQNIVSEIGQKHLDILKAVTIPTGIQDSIGLDANHFRSCGASVGGTACKSVICHR